MSVSSARINQFNQKHWHKPIYQNIKCCSTYHSYNKLTLSTNIVFDKIFSLLSSKENSWKTFIRNQLLKTGPACLCDSRLAPRTTVCITVNVKKFTKPHALLTIVLQVDFHFSNSCNFKLKTLKLVKKTILSN